MKHISDIGEYRELIEGCKKFKKTRSNCFLVPGTVERYIQDGRLLYEEDDGGLIIYVDEERYFTGYYIWNIERDFPKIWSSNEKPVCIEELDVNSRRSAEISMIGNELAKQGLKAELINNGISMDLTLNKESIQKNFEVGLNRLSARGLRFTLCQEQHVEQVINLWENFLAVTDVPYDHLKFMDHKDGKVFCVINERNEVCCAAWWRDVKTSREGRHVVTDPRYYRQGLGQTIINAWLVDACNNGKRIARSWVNAENVKSDKMHEKIGFVHDGRTSRQFILNASSAKKL